MPKHLNDWLERIQRRHPGNIELGLERCSAVWEQMGSPAPARRVIVVAGTNGKGSTVAGIETALHHLGHRVGTYTSPHLLRYNERVRIGCQNADDEALIAGFEAVETALGDTRLTYFEFGTLAAFATMSGQALDFSVLEVGLGGRLDAVNLADAELAVITPIGLDHQEYLGGDREGVGREKAGVMRRAQAVVCSDRDPPASVFSAATELDARLIRIGADFDVSRDAANDGEGEWRYFFADMSAALPVEMSGSHQADNLAAALTAVLLSDPGARSGLEELARIVAACRVRGRLERIASAPDVVVDVGHNPMAATVVREYLDSSGYGPCRTVLAMLSDKDAAGVVGVLGNRVSEWYCAGLTGSRGQSGESLAAEVRNALPDAPVREFATVAEALDAAVEDASGRGLVLVFGSFRTAGEAIMHLEPMT